MNAEVLHDKLIEYTNEFKTLFYKTLEDKKLLTKLNSLADDVANTVYKICEELQNV